MIPTIEKECSKFIIESRGLPLLKNLPKNSDGFRKVKVRKKKNNKELITNVFNDTFKEHHDLIQRCIFAQSVLSFKLDESNLDVEPFYIFPINGYRYMYAKNVNNTTDTYNQTLSKLVENYGEKGIKTFQEILKYQYVFDDLSEGLSTNSDIIIYDIPYYYAIRYTLIDDYSKFLDIKD